MEKFQEIINDALYPAIDLFSIQKDDWGMLVLYITALYAIIIFLIWILKI
jgi:hypothetical protein